MRASAAGSAAVLGFQVPVEEAHQESPLLRERASASSKAVERAREEDCLKGGPERRIGSLCLWVEEPEVAEAVVMYVERQHGVRGPHVREEGLDVTQLLGARIEAEHESEWPVQARGDQLGGDEAVEVHTGLDLRVPAERDGRRGA